MASGSKQASKPLKGARQKAASREANDGQADKASNGELLGFEQHFHLQARAKKQALHHQIWTQACYLQACPSRALPALHGNNLPAGSLTMAWLLGRAMGTCGF